MKHYNELQTNIFTCAFLIMANSWLVGGFVAEKRYMLLIGLIISLISVIFSLVSDYKKGDVE